MTGVIGIFVLLGWVVMPIQHTNDLEDRHKAAKCLELGMDYKDGQCREVGQ